VCKGYLLVSNSTRISISPFCCRPMRFRQSPLAVKMLARPPFDFNSGHLSRILSFPVFSNEMGGRVEDDCPRMAASGTRTTLTQFFATLLKPIRILQPERPVEPALHEVREVRDASPVLAVASSCSGVFTLRAAHSVWMMFPLPGLISVRETRPL
jgi:hypothetical protein